MLYCSIPPPNMEYLAVWIKHARGGREHETRHPSLLGHGLLYNAILMKKLHDIPPSRIRPALYTIRYCSIPPPNMEYLAVWIKPARGGREHETRHPSLLGHGLLYNAILMKKLHDIPPSRIRPALYTIRYCSIPPPNMEYLAVWIKPARGGREHETRYPSLLGHGLLYNAILMKKLHDIPPSRIRPALYTIRYCSIPPPNMEYLAVWIKPARGGREHKTRHPSLLLDQACKGREGT